MGSRYILLRERKTSPSTTAGTPSTYGQIVRVNRGVPSEHDLDLVLARADRVYVLDRGLISHAGPAAPLRVDRELRRQVLWV